MTIDDPQKPVIQLTKEELKTLMEEAVQDAFLKMGIDSNDPLEMQRDFQHLREWRVAVAAMRTKGMLTILGILIAGAAAALWIGIRSMVNGTGP